MVAASSCSFRFYLSLAEVLLNQMYTGTCALFAPLARIIGHGDGKCPHCDREQTVRHFFGCPGRANNRRRTFKDRIPWQRRILRAPLEVLEYLSKEKESLSSDS